MGCRSPFRSDYRFETLFPEQRTRAVALLSRRALSAVSYSWLPVGDRRILRRKAYPGPSQFLRHERASPGCSKSAHD